MIYRLLNILFRKFIKVMFNIFCFVLACVMSEFSIYYCHPFFSAFFLALGPLDPSLLSPAWLLLQIQNRPQVRPKLAENYGLNVVTQSLAFPPCTRPVHVHASHALFQPTTRPPWPSITASRFSRERGSPTCRPTWSWEKSAWLVCHLTSDKSPSTVHSSISIVRLSLSHEPPSFTAQAHTPPPTPGNHSQAHSLAVSSHPACQDSPTSPSAFLSAPMHSYDCMVPVGQTVTSPPAH